MLFLSWNIVLKKTQLRIHSSMTNSSKIQSVCRDEQLKTLLEHVSSPVVGPEPLFLSGPASTGKTLILKQALAELHDALYLYLDCVQCCTSQLLYKMLIKKLARAVYGVETGRGCMHRAITNVSQCITHMVDMLKEKEGMRVWIVLDNVDRVCREGVLPVLDRVSEVSGVDVGLILVSRFPWSSGIFSETYTRGSTCMREPTSVEFPAYTDEELQRICLARGYSSKCQLYTKYYEQFLSLVVPAVTRMSNNILDVEAVLAKLWPVYVAPVKKAAGVNIRARMLSGTVTPLLKNIVSEMDIGMNRCHGALSVDGDTLKSKVLFAIPFMGKWILLASYIASRNKPTTDKAVFDPGYSKKRRKNAQALDRQTERALEMKLQGSHPFPLERMLNIFYYICEPKASMVQTPEDYRDGWCKKLQHVEVTMQVTSLCALGLLTCLGADPLTAPMYRCNVSEDLAYVIARNLKVSLNDYLKLA